jgi:hypothetical protein
MSSARVVLGGPNEGVNHNFTLATILLDLVGR